MNGLKKHDLFLKIRNQEDLYQYPERATIKKYRNKNQSMMKENCIQEVKKFTKKN